MLAPDGDTSPLEETRVVTFGAFAEEYISTIEDGWKNEVHRKQWRSSLRDHSGALFALPIEMVDTDNVVEVLRPIWLTKAETAKRLRGRIERILDAAKVKGLRPPNSINPAMWRGHLALLLPSQSKVERGHHAALPYREAPAFFTQLRARTANAARCLEFTILTATRSGEALGATWAEIDVDAETWTIPAARMKAGQEHVVPLSKAAIEVLIGVMPDDLKLTDHVFSVKGASQSKMPWQCCCAGWVTGM
ncbi:tyrosine-type recombinase/integrase [Sphingomonas sp. XXL09]|uniref:tyrosine-type recombinase/integrase n=1 Tax=Sphingomonas sp. XXL09 TaxID=3457787 RepID=UPI00406BC5F3